MFGLKTAQRVIDAALQEIEDMRAPIDCAMPGDQEHDHEMCRDAILDAPTHPLGTYVVTTRMSRQHWGQDEKGVPMGRDY